ncbi:MAG: hypothetical protein JW700_02350 [Candidatus Aenigmarchaeota archaeon]|nr:hypothetical protein [Candidatus Aenigmarchaeota archaeon]
MAKKQTGWVKASGWLFVLGILISVVSGLVPSIDSAMVTGVLAVMGFIIGLLGALGVGSIDKSDVNMFLLSVVALMAAGGAGAAFENVMYIGSYMMAIVNYIGVLVVPAAVLIALKALWTSASTKF